MDDMFLVQMARRSSFVSLLKINLNGAIVSSLDLTPPLKTDEIEGKIQLHMGSSVKLIGLIVRKSASLKHEKQIPYLISAKNGAVKKILWAK